jgi:hypothetical protein
MREIDALRARMYATAVEEYCDVCGEDGRHDAECPDGEPEEGEYEAEDSCGECGETGRHDPACPEWVCGHGATDCPYCTAIVPADDGPDERP